VHTLTTLKRCGYTGKVYLVIDDEDATAPDYYARYGDQVLMFSKEAIAKTFDEGDNFSDRRTITYARNACFELAHQVGCKYFIELDDDYRAFNYKFDDKARYIEKKILNLDCIFTEMLDYYIRTPFLSIAFAQGGDHLGGSQGTYAKTIATKRKAMNSFICSVDRPFQFRGRFNEDVNTYTALQRAGGLFLTILGLELKQQITQSNNGGITELYKKYGTYVKSFTTVIYAPSCTIVKDMAISNRLHHQINWNATAPKIIRESHRKPAHA
jgi:hypothetical protein